MAGLQGGGALVASGTPVKYQIDLVKVPALVWRFGHMRFPVPKEIVSAGAPKILEWLGGHVGNMIGGGSAGKAVGQFLGGVGGKAIGGVLDGILDLTVTISANGQLRAIYHAQAQADAVDDCGHEAAVAWMNYCPDCGGEMDWPVGNGSYCGACKGPVHSSFNYCWACGQDFGEDNTPRAKAKGYQLEHDCDSEYCDGKVANFMSHCPWCGQEQQWSFDDETECRACDGTVSADWAHCAFCGENP